MRKTMAEMLAGLGGNRRNHIIHRDRSGRVRRTAFAKFGAEVDAAASWLRDAKPRLGNHPVGIIGPPSYEWLFVDLACMKAGVKSVAIPETSKPEFWSTAARDTGVGMVMADIRLKDALPPDWDVCFFGDGGLEPPGNRRTEPDLREAGGMELLEEFTITFSSGTSGTMKAIPIPLRDKTAGPAPGLLRRILGLIRVYRNWGTLWFRKDNRLIVFLPFSHFVQRGMAYLALQRRMDLVISSPPFFLRDLIKEKPNILISAPLIFETLAPVIRDRITALKGGRKALYRVFRAAGINGWSDGNPIKRIARRWLLGDVLAMLGGRPDYFVSGMAPISAGALKAFHEARIRIYQAYGLSETDNIALSSPGCYKLGSVGKPIIPIKIAPDSEILVKSEEGCNAAGFLQGDTEGYLRTGDLGHLDCDGYLFLLGRKDDLIVLANGNKVAPQVVEDRVRDSIEGCTPIVMSIDQEALSLVLGFRSDAGEAMSGEEVRRKLSLLNLESRSHERIAGFHLSPQPFTVESGMLTAVGKIRRKEARERFQAEAFERV